MEIEFLSFTPTPEEKHLGIATIKIYNRIILRWKIVPNKDGSGYFPASASYKLPDSTYTEAFLLDSRSEDEEVKNFIRNNIKKYLQPIKKEESVFQNKQEEELPF